MESKEKLIKVLNITFWVFLVITIILAFREYQYLTASAPSSGNWEIASSNTPTNSYIYGWISYLNTALIGLSGVLTATVYIVKRLFESL